MKKTIAIFVIIVISQLLPTPCDLAFNINNCEAQWVQPVGTFGGNVYSLGIIGNNLCAGAYNIVYLSTNNGTTWTQTDLNKKVYSFAARGNYIFAGTYIYGIYLSTNNGTNWTQTSYNNQTVYSLATSGNYIFAGTFLFGVYFSTNNGTNWTQTTLNNRTVLSLATSGNNIFAGTENYGVYRSTNNGQTWTQTALGLLVYFLAISENNIFAATHDSGVYLSTNNGQTWTQTALNNQWVWSLAISGNNIFAGTAYNGVYLSKNNGQSWIQKNQGWLSPPSVRALLITNDYIFAGLDGYSVWRRLLTEIISIRNISSEVPSDFSLQQNYPNPFNPLTKINFSIPKAEYVKLKIYDALGREIETLVSENLNPGTYQAEWNGSNYASGVFFYRLQAGSFSETKTMMLVK